MPRYRCPSCCCGPAVVLKPPRGALPVCFRCGEPLQKQPLVRPFPLVVLVAVGSVLVMSSIPLMQGPSPPRSNERERTARTGFSTHNEGDLIFL